MGISSNFQVVVLQPPKQKGSLRVIMDDFGHLLPHHQLDLMLDLSPDVRCDAIGQLIGGALEAVQHTLQLVNHGFSRFLLSLLFAICMSLELLYVYRERSTTPITSSHKQIR